MRFLTHLTSHRFLTGWMLFLCCSSPAFAETGCFPPTSWLQPILTVDLIVLLVFVAIWMVFARLNGGRFPWRYAVMVSVVCGLFLYIR